MLRQYGEVDGNSVGSLDGVNYTGTGSARFIKGDGSAIQTGEGNDTVTNYGSITGNNGRAISLEGGNDALNILGGSATVNGDIDGGVGINTATIAPGISNSFSYAGKLSNFSTVDFQSGTTTLLGVSTYTGVTRVSGGELVLDGANRLAATSALDLSGGYLKVSNAGADGQTFVSLTLGDNSIIDLESTSSLTFGGLEAYTAGKTLSIVDYADSVSPGYAIRFLGNLTTDADFLALLGATTVNGSAAEYLFDGTYTDVGLNLAPIPEPATMGFGLVMLGLIGYRRRRVQVVA